MKQYVMFMIFNLFFVFVYAQKEFHVFPKTHKTTPGTNLGNGSLDKPWDLQTALKQSTEIVNGGDTIWLHGGVYSGRYLSTLKSTIKNKNIVVSSFKGEWAILNGNIEMKTSPVLTVRGNNVTYKNFEITPINLKTRDKRDSNFFQFSGVNHTSGKNCQFINLIIHGNNGLGFGSWNKTGGTIISNCLVFDNGFIGKNGKGFGEGFYVQNDSDDQIRILKNNIIFNNYYKGIEVWSASKHAKREWVKNITLDNNVIFNSGLPSSYRIVDNIIVATDDREGVNIAKKIIVKNNILYHNTNFLKNEVNGDAASLTLGFHKNAPVENVVIDNNIIIGRNNALRILYAKSLTLTNNTIYSGYVFMVPAMEAYFKSPKLKFDNNSYYTKNSRPIRFSKKSSYSFENWKSKFSIDVNSNHKNTKKFDLPSVLDITQNEYNPNSYRVVLFSKNEDDVVVDFTNYSIPNNSDFTIRDVENYNAELVTGMVDKSSMIIFPMNLERHVTKTLNNFGVYVIEFSEPKKEIKIDTKKEDNLFKRFFKWLF